MADTDTFYVQAPQTDVLVAFAAKRFYQSLMQQGPSSMQKYYQGQVNYWEKEARERAYKFAMKQTPVTKVMR